MTQPLASDFPIDPTTTSGTALADILNRFSEAVGTNNSGATAPPDTTPGMFWLDTSTAPNGVLKMRNAANTAWIIIATPGGPYMLADGTVAAPGLAFANEPATGMYRAGPGNLRWSSAGVMFVAWDASTSGTTLYTHARANDSAVEHLSINQPSGNPNYQRLQVGLDGTGNGHVYMSGVGTKAKGQLGYDATAHNFSGGPINVANGNVRLTALSGSFLLAGDIFGLSQDANNSYVAFSPGWFFAWTKANGSLMFQHGVNTVITQFDQSGNFRAGQNVYSRNGPSMWWDGANANFLSMQQGSAGAWSWLWNRSNGLLSWLGGSANSVFSIDGNGNVTAPGALSIASVSATNLSASNNVSASVSLSSPGRQYFGGQIDMSGALGINFTTGQTAMTIAQGDPSYGQTAAWQIYHDAGQSAGMRMLMGSIQHQLRSDGTAFNNGGWNVFSDRRLKTNIEPIRNAMAKLRRVTGYVFDRIDQRDYHGRQISAAGLIAQEWQDVEPLTVTDSGNAEHHLAISAMGPLALLVNAVKELDERLASLEVNPT